MQRCEKCKITVTGMAKRCPLCQGDLTGQPEERSVYPAIPPARHPHRTLLRLIMLATVAVAIICVSVNYSLPAGGWWSLFVVAGFASLWVTFGFAVKKLSNPPKGILWQVGVISALAGVWDFFTGAHGWSVDYVVPLVCASAMVAMAVVARMLKLRIEDYIIYLVLVILMGIIPLAFLLSGRLRVSYPSTICVAVSLISLAALLIFEGKALRAEILRRLHL